MVKKSTNFLKDRRVIITVIVITVILYILFMRGYYFEPKCMNVCSENGMNFKWVSYNKINPDGCACELASGLSRFFPIPDFTLWGIPIIVLAIFGILATDLKFLFERKK